MNTFEKISLNIKDVKNLSFHLQYLIKKAKLTESELARAINLPLMTVRRIISGETEDPRISTLKLFSDYFRISIDELIYGFPTHHATHSFPILKPKFIPILEWPDIENESTFLSINKLTWNNWHPISMTNQSDLNDECIAIHTKPTMQPRFPHGTLLILNQNETPLDGDLVLIRFSQNEISLREYVIDSPNKILYPTIQGSEPILFNELNHRILGVIVLTLMYPRKISNPS